MEKSFLHGLNVSHFMAQIPSKERFGLASEFGPEDARWIAVHGFDHIRLPVDGRIIADSAGELDTFRITQLKKALDETLAAGLNVILELHFLHGANHSDAHRDTRLYTDASLIKVAISVWQRLAEYFLSYGDELRFEVLNEPVADSTADLDNFYDQVLAGIRSIDSRRVVLIGSNLWCQIKTLVEMQPRKDPFVVYTIHYYEPLIFTHQGTHWTKLGELDLGVLPFPGQAPDLSLLSYVPEELKHFSSIEMTEAAIDAHFEQARQWAGANRQQIYLGEFGAYHKIPLQFRESWYRAVLNTLKSKSIPWAVWDYRGAFAVRDRATGKATPIYTTLAEFLT